MPGTTGDIPSGVHDFAQLAEAYCRLIDERAQYSGDQLLSRVHGLLPRLYAAALALPAFGYEAPDDEWEDEDEDEEGDEKDEPYDIEVALAEGQEDRVPHEQSREVFRSLGSMISELDSYAEVFDPYGDPQEELVTGCLSDDLTDIYGEIADGLAKWRRGEHENAAHEWRMSFIIHWGEHLTGALRAIHALAADGKLTFPAGTP